MTGRHGMGVVLQSPAVWPWAGVMRVAVAPASVRADDAAATRSVVDPIGNGADETVTSSTSRDFQSSDLSVGDGGIGTLSLEAGGQIGGPEGGAGEPSGRRAG